MNTTTPEFQARLRAVEIEADAAFWNVVAERFPEALSGDVEPSFAYDRQQTNEAAILYWLEGNVPEMAEDEASPRPDTTFRG